VIAARDRVEAHASARKHLAVAEFIRRRPEKGCEQGVAAGGARGADRRGDRPARQRGQGTAAFL